MKILNFLLLSTLCLVAISCSSSAGGADEEGTLSDEDIAMGDRYGDGNIPKGGEGGMFNDVHFDYDSSSVRAEDQETIRAVAKFLRSNPEVQAELEGHCDRRGTSEYNMALGERRAKSVATLLVDLGGQSKQISTISYGEEIPVDSADTDSAYVKNRRVHFTLYKKQAK